MPLVTVYGIPATIPENTGITLITEIQRAVAAVPELGILAEEVEVYFPVDIVQSDLGESFSVTMEGLFDKPERTPEVRNRLAEMIAEATKRVLQSHLKRLTPPRVKVFIRTFHPERGGLFEG